MREKVINLPDGTGIIDGYSRLLVLHPDVNRLFTDGIWDGKPIPVSVTPFVTNKGRTAFKIEAGSSYLFWKGGGSGDKSWRDFDARRDTQALMHEAIPASNGGGCWSEVQIWDPEVGSVTAEQEAYLDEIF